MTFRLTPLAALIALPVAPAMASGIPSEIPTLDSIVVTASRPGIEPVSVLRLNETDLAPRRAASSDSASLLRDVPGVALQTGGGVSSLPVIHGLADDRLRIKVDGMDLIAACPNHMNSPLSYIDPSAVANVQVYAGVSPVSVGGDSIGGSIVADSAPAAFAQPGQGTLLKGEAGTFYRSNGEAHGANVSATLASDRVSLNYSAAYAKSGNYDAGDDFKTYLFTGRSGHTLDQDEVGSTAYETINQSLRLAWKNDDHLFDFKYGHQNIPYENYPNQRMDLTDNASDQFNLAYTGRQAWGQLKARAYYEHTEHEMDFGEDKRFWYGTDSGGSSATNGTPCTPLGTTCAAGMPMYTEGQNRGLVLQGDLRLAGGDTLRLGGEIQAYRLDDWWPPSGAGMWPDTFWNIRDGERDRYALFGELEQRRGDWTHVLGLRHETVKMDTGEVQGYCTSGMCMGNQITDSTAFNAQSHARTDHNWDLSWLARFTPDATRSYALGLARKTRSPNLYERYSWSTWSMAAVMNNYVGDGNGYVGNLDLEPEVAHTLSLSADWHDAGQEQWGLKLTPYLSYVRDYIDAQCLPGTTCGANQFNVLQYINQSARIYGIDLSGHVVAARGTGFGDLTLKAQASYTRGKNRDTGDGLYNIMPLNARVALVQQFGAWRNTLEAEFVARKDDVSGVRNEMETAGYGLAHLRLRYEQKTFSVDFGIENLFDRLYDLPLGGAYLGQGTTMSMNPPAGNYPQWGTPVPGPGRSLYAGLNVKF